MKVYILIRWCSHDPYIDNIAGVYSSLAKAQEALMRAGTEGIELYEIKEETLDE